MEYLLKCKQTQQSLCRPEAAIYKDKNKFKLKKKFIHQTPAPKSQKRKEFWEPKRITWIWIKPQPIQNRANGCYKQTSILVIGETGDQPHWE